MAKLEPGIVLAIRFPFSDLSRTKLRPALVLADAGKGDWILCQITSKSYSDNAAVCIDVNDFASGSLPLTSYARPGKLFTANNSLFEKPLGKLATTKHREVIESVCHLLKVSNE